MLLRLRAAAGGRRDGAACASAPHSCIFEGITLERSPYSVVVRTIGGLRH
jgi:hypothetical protein